MDRLWRSGDQSGYLEIEEMSPGYYYNILSAEDWVEGDEYVDSLLQEKRVFLVNSTMFSGGQKVFVVIFVPQELSTWESLRMYDWEQSGKDVRLTDIIPDAASQQPFAYDVDDVAKAIEQKKDEILADAKALKDGVFRDIQAVTDSVENKARKAFYIAAGTTAVCFASGFYLMYRATSPKRKK